MGMAFHYGVSRNSASARNELAPLSVVILSQNDEVEDRKNEVPSTERRRALRFTCPSVEKDTSFPSSAWLTARTKSIQPEPMNPPSSDSLNRRNFLKKTAGATAVSALAGVSIPFVHAAENNTVQVSLVGCGGRGTGAA